MTIALERPGASADGGDYADRVELENVKARFPLPGPLGAVPAPGGWGHVQVAGIVREMEWDDLPTTSTTSPAAPPAGAST